MKGIWSIIQSPFLFQRKEYSYGKRYSWAALRQGAGINVKGRKASGIIQSGTRYS